MKAAHLQVESVLDMLGERLQRLSPVSALDHPDKIHVIAKRFREINVLNGDEQRKGNRFGPDDVEHFEKEPVSRPLDERAVNVAVGLAAPPRRPVFQILLPLDDLAQPGDVVRGLNASS